jgi:hypothetical protein
MDEQVDENWYDFSYNNALFGYYWYICPLLHIPLGEGQGTRQNNRITVTGINLRMLKNNNHSLRTNKDGAYDPFGSLPYEVRLIVDTQPFDQDITNIFPGVDTIDQQNFSEQYGVPVRRDDDPQNRTVRNDAWLPRFRTLASKQWQTDHFLMWTTTGFVKRARQRTVEYREMQWRGEVVTQYDDRYEWTQLGDPILNRIYLLTGVVGVSDQIQDLSQVGAAVNVRVFYHSS